MTAEQPLLWWQSGVVYQIYPRSFQDSNGDGVGDLPGILSRVEYLPELGVDAVWLSPFYPSPMADFGYDVSDYTDVHPLFGTLQDFDALTAALHQRGIKIIIDFVPNHTSNEHPWFQESRSSRDNPKRDWYVWADARPDGTLPNNWLSAFGGTAWEWDETTGQYYLHSFLEEQPDLNWRNPEVREAMLDAMRFWLDRGVDGFRIDVAHFVMKDPELRDNPPNPAPSMVPSRPVHEYDMQLHVHDRAHPDVHGVFRAMRRVLDSYSAEHPRMAVGELHVFDFPEWATYYGKQLDELHLPFNFSLLFSPWNVSAIRRVVEGIEAACPPGAWPNYVFGNHDEHRVASRVGREQARVAMMLLLTLRGTPTVYYGDEIAMEDVPIPPEREQDPFGKRVTGLGLGRDPQRTPMQWDASPNGGFCPPEVEPWLPLAADHDSYNVAAERDDPGSMLTLTRRLLALRREKRSLHAGSYRTADSTEDCFLYVRESDGQSYLIALNLTDQEQTVQVQGQGTIVLSTALDRDGEVAGSALTLRANEGCVLELQS